MAPPAGPPSVPRVAFVFANPRRRVAAEVAAGRRPDTELLGQNHLGDHAIHAFLHDSSLRPGGGALQRRVVWSLRELVLPLELGTSVDAVFTPLAALLPLAARARRLGVVVVNYGLCTIWARSGRFRRRLLRASLSAADSVVCLGSWQRDLLLRQTGLDARRVTTLRLGVDERFFAPAQTPVGDDPLVLAVGKDLARDYQTLAEAVEPLGVRMEIVCLPRNVERVRLPARTRARFVDAETLRALYREAACVVVPQRRADFPYGSEGGGLTALLEAMASAKPVVASARPILGDYVDHERTALLVPPEDPVALAAAIRRVLTDPDLAASLGTAARRRVEQGLTTRHFAARLAPLLARAAG